jgi:N-acetylglucosaminyl-diphospho-decaprenol L-rhamnosyltransferase
MIAAEGTAAGTAAGRPAPARVAVVTVSYDSAGVLGPFLDSVPPAASEPVELRVADNKAESSQRGVVERLTVGAGGRYLPLPRNRGYGDAMNAAVATLPATVEFVLISNPDVLLTPGALDTLLGVIADDPAVAAVGPRILESDGRTYPSARAIPSLRNGIGHALFANVWPTNPFSRAYHNDSAEALRRRDAGWLSGACLLVRRSAFEALGGFDTGYFMYFEDVDLGFRLGKAGWRSVYEPDAVVVHSGAHSTAGESARMLEAHHASAKRFLARKYSGPVLWPLRAVLSLGLDVRSAFVRRRADH